MVNIIIPAYNAHKTIRQAIASVTVQDNQKDIKLTIVDDHSDESYDYLLDDYKYLNIDILRKPFNSGPGQARQYGIDNTECEYLIFLDADDCLYSPEAVKKLLTTIKDGNYDVVSSVFLEEIPHNSDYVVHQNDFVWMHGKIYRTEYIKKYNIRFNETRTNEDNAFNAIIFGMDAKIYFLEYVTYIWKNNSASITRSGDFLASNIHDFILNSEYALKELMRMNAPKENLKTCVVQYMISFYAYYLTFLKQNKNSKFISEFILYVKKYYKNAPTEYRRAINDEYLKKIFYNHFLINKIIFQGIIMNPSIYDFINIIKNEQF